MLYRLVWSGIILVMLTACGLAGAPLGDLPARGSKAATSHLASAPTRTPTGQVTATPVKSHTPAAARTPAATLSLPVSLGTPAPVLSEPISIENAGQVRELARYGKGTPLRADFSPDGRFLAVATPDSITIYNAHSFSELHSISLRSGLRSGLSGFQFVFSPDGAILAIQSAAGRIDLWQTTDWTVLRTLEGINDPYMDPIDGAHFYHLGFSPDGKLMAAGRMEGQVRLWAIPSGEAVHDFGGYDVIFSSDPSVIAIRQKSKVEVRNLSTGEILYTQMAGDFYDSAVEASPDGSLLGLTWRSAGGLASQTNAAFYRFSDGRMVGSVQNYGVISPDSSTIATTLQNRQVQLFAAPGGKLIRTMIVDGEIGCWGCKTVFSPDGSLLAVEKSDGAVQIWDLTGRKVLFEIQHHGTIAILHFDPSGAYILTGAQDGSLRATSLAGGQLLHSFPGYTSEVYDAQLSMSSDVIALTSSVAASLIQASDGSPLGEMLPVSERGGYVPCCLFTRFTPDGQRVALIDPNEGAWIYRARGMVLEESWGLSYTSQLEISPDGSLVALVDGGRVVEVLSLSERNLKQSIPTSREISGIAFSPDGAQLATIGEGLVEIWKLPDGELEQSLRTNLQISQDWNSGQIAYSPDGSLLAAWSNQDGALELWEPGTGERVRTIELRPELLQTGESTGPQLDHLPGFNRAVFSPDGTLLATSDGWGLVGIWNTSTGSLLKEFSADAAGLFFSPDGDRLYIISGSGVLSVWGISF